MIAHWTALGCRDWAVVVVVLAVVAFGRSFRPLEKKGGTLVMLEVPVDCPARPTVVVQSASCIAMLRPGVHEDGACGGWRLVTIKPTRGQPRCGDAETLQRLFKLPPFACSPKKGRL